ncbi:hypothetical protein [Halopiger goleimassiliensis]|uniref:hypothetical protein n=1 Tax=Halopiger goleimassiliensis TaxID=1293048 RepID=UPI00067812C2|nr:hypothetical protein [Halopiger goleimassiliensis]
MGFDAKEFVADDLWLLIGMVTFGLVALVGLTGIEALASAIAIVGWFVLVPLFLFWGEELAELLVADRDERDASDDERSDDALEALKRQYAEGKIDDREFERRLERLVGVDDALADVFEDESNEITRDDALEARDGDRRDRAFERER